MKFTRTLLSAIFLLTVLIVSCDETTKPKVDDNNGDSPVINTLAPIETYPGYPLEITGDFFGFEQGTSYVEINGKKVTTYLRWSIKYIKLIIPADATSGKVVVKVGSLSSNSKDISLLVPVAGDSPVIKAFDKDLPLPRESLGIEGSNFGDTQGESFITLNGEVVENISSWRDRKIVMEVPSNAVSGKLIVFVKGLSSNQMQLDIKSEKLMLEQVLIPAGTFLMGADNEDLAFNSPIHEVTIAKPFYMSKYEITQGDWETLQFTIGFGHNSLHEGPDYPVERVSWVNACKFCNALSKIERFKPAYTIDNNGNVTIDWNANGYRLPTEAEWEFAARAGNQYKYGKDDKGGEGNVHNMAWHNENSESETHEVGKKQANAYGVYDILGNVREWCWDWFDADYYTTVGNNISDPKGPENSDGTKVLRGGGYTDDRLNMTVSYRWSYGYDLPESEYYIGFRVVRNAW